MKQKPAVVLLCVMSLITSLIVGCATLTYDKLPDNVPKGYVEFYSKGVTGLGTLVWYVCKYENGKEREITGSVWSGEQRRRIAERPGTHTFIVKFGTAANKITVEVIEGMIIPVRVIIKPGTVEHGLEHGLQRVTYHFNMDLSVERPAPFVK